MPSGDVRLAEGTMAASFLLRALPHSASDTQSIALDGSQRNPARQR
jgi:hypothetical protein